MVYSIFLLYKAFEICVLTAAPVKLLKMKHSLEPFDWLMEALGK